MKSNNNNGNVRKSTSKVIGTAIMAITLLLAVVGVAVTNVTTEAEAAASDCNCVVMRFDDIQDYWHANAQSAVIDTFVSKNANVTGGMIMNYFGSDAVMVNKVKSATNTGNKVLEPAIHGWNHERFDQLTLAQQTSLLQQSQTKFSTIFGSGIKTPIFLVPNNEFNANTLRAMSAANMSIISAAPYSQYYIQNPSTVMAPTKDSFGIWHEPQTIRFGYDEGGVHKWNSNTAIINAVKADIAENGWGVVTLHPQDFFTYPNTANVSATRVAQLGSLIDGFRAEGIKLSTMKAVSGLTTTTTPPPAPDTTKPTVTVTQPTAGATVKVNTPTVVKGTAADNVGVVKVEVRATTVDGSVGTTYATATQTGSGWSTWSYTLTIPNTNYKVVTARATDAAGNQQWAKVTVNVVP